jgi:hypothetical protein
MDFRIFHALVIAMMMAFTDASAQPATASDLRADPFSALVGKRQPREERAAATAAVERFVIATDDRVFLFQSGDRQGRLKFLCKDGDQRIDCLIDDISPAEEIHVVNAARISRGDVAWRDADGATLLRVAAYGGVTIFWPGEERGHAAAKSFGEDPPLVLDPATLETASRRAQRATALISARIGAPIVFDIGALAADAEGGATVLADAVARAAKGVAEVAVDPTGAKVLGVRLQRVEFVAGADPALEMRKGVLRVGYNPAGDVLGRPSSARIAKFLEESL